MKICIPVEEDKGIESQVCLHFGSAPGFMIVDTETGSHRLIANRNQHHGHGQCTPLSALQGEEVDAMAVGGIGGGALNKLTAANIRVYGCAKTSVAEIVADFKAGKLQPMQSSSCCQHHGHNH